MKKWLMSLLAVLLLAGCSAGAGSEAPPVEWAKDPGTVVFQIDQVGGFVPAFEATSDIPELTVFGDGTVVVQRFEDNGIRRVLTAKLTEPELARLLALADKEMAGLKADYNNGMVADAGTTRFGVVTKAATRLVNAYAFSSEGPSDMDADKAAYDKLRAVSKAFYDALPKEMVPYLPAKVTLLTEALDPQQVSGEIVEWPKELTPLPVPPAGNDNYQPGVAEVTGEAVRALAQAIPYRSNRLYKQGEGYYLVAVQPDLPRLFKQ